MISVRDVELAMAQIDASFRSNFPKGTQALLAALLKRLREEITTVHTELDETYIELRMNLERFSKHAFTDASAAREAFKTQVVDKLCTDFEGTEIPRFVQLARQLRRLG